MSTENDEFLERALNIANGPPPPYTPRQKLQRPVAIPQVLAGLGQPFSMGYGPDLSEHGVSMEEFVKFIDNLNIVSAGSPPLQIVDLAGGVVGMVPHHYTQAIGGGLQTVAKIGTAAVSKTRGSMFLSKSNSDFFNPRGLKVELVTSKALKVKLNMDPEARFTTSNNLLPNMSAHERRVHALGDLVAPVTFNVPPPDPQSDALSRMAAAQQAKKVEKFEKKVTKERQKQMESDESSSDSSSSDADNENETQKLQMKIELEAEKRDLELKTINQKYELKLLKKPEDAPKIEREKSKKIEKARKECQEEIEDLEHKIEKLSRRGKKRDDRRQEKREKKDNKKDERKEKRKKEDKETKALNKIQWILVESL